MSLRSKIVGVGVGLMMLMGAVLFVAYRRDARRQVTQQYVEKARSIVLIAESTREEMGSDWQRGIFSAGEIRQWAAAGQRDRILSVVPVVTAWRAAMAKSKDGGYTFKVPKFEPRNPLNQPDVVEARVLKLFESSAAAEHFEIDTAKNVVRYFRPIRLTQDCLMCHGDPRTSQALWGRADGRDPTGGPMENWHVGDVHGAFEVVQSLDEADARIAASTKAGAVLLGALILVAGAVFLFGVPAIIQHDLVKPIAEMVRSLTDGSSQVTSAAGQVAASSQSLSQGATEQAASLEETSASMEEMASMTRKNAEHAAQAATLVADVAKEVGDSNAALTQMVGSMSAIKDSSSKIAKIIKTIDEIAFQTNILALNAAVEAARAGEAGMGFAVVANEVRNLAQRSAQAAKDTAVLIEESIGRSQEGAAQVEAVAKAIGSITGSVAHVKGIVDQVREASLQQTQGIDQVSQAIAQMEKVTQTTAATAEESAAASEELNAQAKTSMDVVRDLDALVGGERAQSATLRVSVPVPRRRAATAKVVPIAIKRGRTANSDIPMGDTGTYGKV